MNRGERRALLHYRLRGFRLLGANVRAGRYELDLVVRRGRRLVVAEVKEKRGDAYGDPLEMIGPEKARRVRLAANGLARAPSRPRRARASSSRRSAYAAAAWSASRSADGGPVASAPKERSWLRPRPRSTATSREKGSSSPGPRRSSPSASARSTSTGCTRTSGSSSRSSSRRCSAVRAREAGGCSTPSPARGRRSSRPSSPGTTRSASTSPPSTACSCA